MLQLVGCMVSRSRVCVYSITSSSEKELISCMCRSQKGSINKVDKSKLTPIQTQLNVKYQSYVMTDVCSGYFIELCIICKDL